MVSFAGRIARKLIKNIMRSKPIYKRGGFVYFGLISAKKSFFIKPSKYTLKKYKVDDIPVEMLIKNKSKNQDKVIFQIHGGAFLIPLIDLFRKLAVKYSKLSDGATVVNLDYRTAPKHKYPSARDDSEKVYFDLLEKGYKPENIIIVGDSAGGNTLLSLVAKLRNENKPLPKALICMSPWGDLSASGKSYYDNLYVDVEFGMDKKMNFNSHRIHLIDFFCIPYAGHTPLKDKGLSPVFESYENFPPMLIQVGGDEMLLSDSKTIHKKAINAGTNCTLTIYEGMFHTFQTLVNIPESRQAWKEVSNFLKKHFYNM